jgi:hypothetical protein
MASFRSISGTTYASRTDTTITAPAGIVDGDILILAHVVGNPSAPGPAVTLPSGSYTITHSTTSTDGVIICVQDGSTDIRTSSNSEDESLITTSTAIGVNTSRTNSLVAFIAHNWNLYGAGSPPSGTTPTFTERQDNGTSLIYVATGDLAASGATGDKTHANLNSGGVPSGWAVFLAAIESPVEPETLTWTPVTRAVRGQLTTVVTSGSAPGPSVN